MNVTSLSTNSFSVKFKFCWTLAGASIASCFGNDSTMDNLNLIGYFIIFLLNYRRNNFFSQVESNKQTKHYCDFMLTIVNADKGGEV